MFCKSSRLPARMISDSLKAGKQRQSETTKGDNARFEANACKYLRKLSFSALPPAWFHIKCDENKEKTVALRIHWLSQKSTRIWSWYHLYIIWMCDDKMLHAKDLRGRTSGFSHNVRRVEHKRSRWMSHVRGFLKYGLLSMWGDTHGLENNPNEDVRQTFWLEVLWWFVSAS